MKKIRFPVLTVVLLFAMTQTSAAHVSVDTSVIPKDGIHELTFRVPNERDDATTTKVEIAFPEETPFANVSVKSIPGWSSSIAKTTLTKPLEIDGSEVAEVVSRITWLADDGIGVRVGKSENFTISVGPLPETVDAITFKTLQTYNTGEVVRWIQNSPASGKEAAHPAPVLDLSPVETTEAAAGSSTNNNDEGSVRTLALGVAGVVALAVVVASVARRRTRT